MKTLYPLFTAFMIYVNFGKKCFWNRDLPDKLEGGLLSNIMGKTLCTSLGLMRQAKAVTSFNSSFSSS